MLTQILDQHLEDDDMKRVDLQVENKIQRLQKMPPAKVHASTANFPVTGTINTTDVNPW